MKKNRIAAIVIAAGYSSRMDGFKPLLKFGNETAVERVVNTYRKAGVDQIILVLGYRAEEIRRYFEKMPVECVLNENFDQGMYTSIVRGVGMLDTMINAFFIHPVDIPLVKEQTIKRMMAFFEKNEKGIIYPGFSGERGHPPLIHKRYERSILTNKHDGGLKRLLERHSDDALDLPLADESILMDMDTPEDYKLLLGYASQTAPNMNECYALLDIYQVPADIRKHSEKVKEVALFILKELTEKEISLDTASLLAAALLHDIVRKEKNHPQMGARLLGELGYEKVGDIIATHMDIMVAEKGIITENEILYLADKFVKNDQLIDLETRKNETLKKFAENPEVAVKIKQRFENAIIIKGKIEAITGKGLLDGKRNLFSQTW